MIFRNIIYSCQHETEPQYYIRKEGHNDGKRYAIVGNTYLSRFLIKVLESHPEQSVS